MLKIVTASQSTFHELPVQFTSDFLEETSVAPFLQQEEDASSSLCDPPSLPGGAIQVRNQGDYSEGDKTSQASFPLLYGSIPTCSDLGTDTGEDT